jgi:hypothetical protein
MNKLLPTQAVPLPPTFQTTATAGTHLMKASTREMAPRDSSSSFSLQEQGSA